MSLLSKTALASSLSSAAAHLAKAAAQAASPKKAAVAPPPKPPAHDGGSLFEPAELLKKGLKATIEQTKVPAKGVGFDKYPGAKVDAPLLGDLKHPTPGRYDQVIDQFKVGSNPRYAPRDVVGLDGKPVHKTFCNVFVTDVCLAMGAATPTPPYSLSANEHANWLANPKEGGAKGWKSVTADEAQKMANGGKPVVAAWNNPTGSGHVAMVRPGENDPVTGPTVASAGEHCYDQTHLSEGFKTVPQKEIKFYVYDP